jgi:non-ribosomal peptide synthetase component F
MNCCWTFNDSPLPANYPIAERIEGYGSDKHKTSEVAFKLTNINVFEQTNYDLNVVFGITDELSIRLQYNANVYDRDFIERISRQLERILHQVIENEELEIGELTLLSDEEKNRVLVEFNNPGSRG